MYRMIEPPKKDHDWPEYETANGRVPQCGARSGVAVQEGGDPEGYYCTRAVGHCGFHKAHVPNGLVVAMWDDGEQKEERDDKACS